MKMSRVVFFIGLLLYIGSFFLTAVIGVKEVSGSLVASGFSGYTCALTTLLSPWGHEGWEALRDTPLEYFPILFSGWINPVFLITAIALLVKPNGRPGALLRIVVIVMFPACWIVFYQMNLRPRAGYFLWTAAMLLVLFSTMFSREKRQEIAAAAA
jgi:hypothetical protein